MLASFAQALGSTARVADNTQALFNANDQHYVLMNRVAALQSQKSNVPPNSPQALAIDAQLAQLQKTEKALLIQKELAHANQMALYAMRDAAQQAQADETKRRQQAIQNGFIFG